MTESDTLVSQETSGTAATPRRIAPRYPCRHVTFYKPVAGRKQEAELATVQNISICGIGLLVREPIKPGTILIIELNSTVRGVQHQRLARVTHVTDQGNGYLLVGCEFATRLSESELQAVAY